MIRSVPGAQAIQVEMHVIGFIQMHISSKRHGWHWCPCPEHDCGLQVQEAQPLVLQTDRGQYEGLP